MGKLLGFGLILAGLVVGGVAVPLSARSPSGQDAVISAAAFTTGMTSIEPSRENEARSVPVTALKPLAAPAARDNAAVLPAASSQPEKPRAAHPALKPPVAPAARKPIVPAFETEVIPSDPAAITRNVQAELARVGCYSGPVTGHWGPETRRAMKAFTERVNATLPIDKPDVILLSLLKAQPVAVCGKACPAGQANGADGRCMPKAVLAQAARKALPPLPKAAVVVRDVTPKTPDEGKREVVAAAPQAPASHVAPAAPVGLFAPVYSEGQRMALAGPVATDTSLPAAAPPAVAAVAPPATEKPVVKPVRKHERREHAPAKVSFGQTQWARNFFRSNQAF